MHVKDIYSQHLNGTISRKKPVSTSLRTGLRSSVETTSYLSLRFMTISGMAIRECRATVCDDVCPASGETFTSLLPVLSRSCHGLQIRGFGHASVSVKGEITLQRICHNCCFNMRLHSSHNCSPNASKQCNDITVCYDILIIQYRDANTHHY